MTKSLREVLALRGCDLIFEYKGSAIGINTAEFTDEKEEAVYQKFGLRVLRGRGITLYNPDVWGVDDEYRLILAEDCLAPEQPFFTKAPCLRLEGTKDLRHWDVESAKDLSGMFYCCELESLSLDGWDVSRVKDMAGMFEVCSSLKKLSLDGWDVSRVRYFSWMFYNCRSLKSLSLGGWCISEDAGTSWMFDGCPAGISVESLVAKGSATQCLAF